jgi:FkbM family methyltransferase
MEPKYQTVTISGVKIAYRGNEYGVIPEVYNEDPYRVKEIKENGIVIDIGGCIGVFSIRCAKERNCVVYAYEPYLESYNLLVYNTKANGLENKIIAFNKAVSNKKEVIDFYIHPNHFAGSTFHPVSGIPYIIEKVECITLTDIFEDNNLDRCDLVKLDCEEEEKNILFECQEFNRIDKIILEYHLYADGKEIMEYLRKKGYLVQSPVGDVLPPVERSVLYATRL